MLDLEDTWPKQERNTSFENRKFTSAGQDTKQKGLKPTSSPRVVFLKAGTFPTAFLSHSAAAGWNQPPDVKESLFCSITSKHCCSPLAGKLSAPFQFLSLQPSTCSSLPLSHSSYGPASHKNIPHLCMLSHSLGRNNLPLPFQGLPVTKNTEWDQQTALPLSRGILILKSLIFHR